MPRPLATLLVLGLLLGPGCELLSVFSGSARHGEIVTYGVPGDLAGWDPLAPDVGWNEATSALFSGLYRIDENGRVVPDLALDEPQPAGPHRQIVHLRRGVSWHDGMAFRARDVARTIKHLRTLGTTPDTVISRRGWIEQLDRALGPAKVIDEHTVALATDTPSRRLAEMLVNLPILPAHHMAPDGRLDFGETGRPIGTGPFKLAGIDPHRWIRLAPVESHHVKRPRLEGLILRPVGDPAERIRLLRSGEIDMAPVRPQDAATLEALPALKVHDIPTGRFLALTLNVQRGALARPEARMILDAALDREAIARGVFGSGGRPAYEPLHPRCWAFPENLAAEQSTTGVSSLDARGPTMEVDLAVWADETAARRASELLRDQLAAHGITIRRHLVDRPPSGKNPTSTILAHYDALLSEWDGMADPVAGLRRLFHSSGQDNLGGFSDGVLDQLFDQAAEMEPGPRACRVVEQMLARIRTARCMLPLAYATSALAARRDLKFLDVAFLSSAREFTRFAYRWSF